MDKCKKTVVVGVTGGIAVYKALDVISKLKKKNFDIHVVMTKSAMEFVTPLTFQTISQNIVNSDMFSEPRAWEIQHISLAKKADLMLIVPATANIIGKVASGIADDLLSTTIMATKSPVVFAPAMNTNMYNNPIVQQNIDKLSKLGYEFIKPDSGRLACGDIGDGKLPDTSFISGIIESMLYDKKDLKGKNVLVTAGPTLACIDPVRYITNKSSGKMGYCIAEEARDRGAKVTLISGPTKLPIPFGINHIGVNTNREMLNAVLDNFDSQDIVVKAAAVADYKPKVYSDIKIKKSEDELSLNFVKDTDILKRLGEIKTKQILVGFAAESNDLIKNAEGKLKRKNLDYIVANNITAVDTGFASDDNKVTVLSKTGEKLDLLKMSKRQLARKLFDIIDLA
ncbi:bifunctional phosphopantothenoylcysteine decarboxylase/phosphopantothenate--cysteine ligase CoaBC [Clostridium tyrobutyricum]|mgnify:CR=1 FL=1|jgi:phosphopantothenoylcysteine decarboxylase/phosphopantothenate--cysteine ligase|uniref:Coenzyme A biosynthesis bifunctional protein CoaBC n=1 Tax=Clostridium tyrobutyricum DIVETGP TaxID=1408889 RepID=W6N234_CLOTY|nr:bifunctional phosphopantothenoylcysteine decarboxylase/phosphopantothenate--cysteine ligase CoaBC [Clostridium tyrobutyricum]AND85100.1 putative coenzyme A biosynthesis bifunctional protein [Clostridium tyrobutyricum]ANP69658.1 phosphopantothenoylcysteine decarboxylase [Clostridium tyrobutyricum]MBR9647007.1 bifunctional phosphopantothenoylcysteine decarboxylase/phosphopantothenate--cysteine ligase CoaBC [Clostridium tyrobutyricum]MBV4414928.1 bifunctional phosphopantothenoylcysteine decarbo